MSLSQDINTYEDIRPHLDRALESPRGIRVTTRNKGQAIHLRQRLYKLRSLDTKRTLELFDPGDSRRGVSIWKDLVISIEDNAILIQHGEPIKIEEL